MPYLKTNRGYDQVTSDYTYVTDTVPSFQSDEETESSDDLVNPDEIGLLLYSEWPKYIESEGTCIIGPNGTTLTLAAFEMIDWTRMTTAKATRALLRLVFNEGIPAKDTPCSKRYAKKGLNHLKTDDVVHCVLVMVQGGSESAARAAIANVCTDAVKRYKKSHN